VRPRQVMNIKRKIERSQLKQLRKMMRRSSKEIESMLDSAPKACSVCAAEFDTKKYPEQLDTWQVELGSGDFKLTCEVCKNGKQ
jgi:hypothetical protein